MKKERGSAGDIVFPLLAILASGIVIMSFLSVIKLASVKEDVKQLTRKYTLEMETVGYLEASSATQLKVQLEGLGVTDIDLAGTTISDVGYGNAIYLCVSCAIPYEKLNLGTDFLQAVFEDTKFPITVKRMSTAKN